MEKIALTVMIFIMVVLLSVLLPPNHQVCIATGAYDVPVCN